MDVAFHGVNEWDILWLKCVDIDGLNGWGITNLNGWGIYGSNGWGSLVYATHFAITHTLVPTAPTILAVEATSSTSISVHWTASKKDGVSPTTGYVVEYRHTTNPVFETQMVPRDVFSTTLGSLKPSTMYEVRVRGENAVGHSDASATKQAKTKVDGELNSQEVVEELLKTFLSSVNKLHTALTGI